MLVFGTVAYDDVETPSGTRIRQLGGSAAYFAVAVSYFTDVAILSIVGDDFAASDLELLEGHAIDVSGIEVGDGATFHWAGTYLRDLNNAETLATDLNVLVDYEPQVKPQHRSPELLFLANGDPQLQLATLNALDRRPSVVAGDTMNHWIVEKRDALATTIGDLDIAIVNEAEALLLTGEPGIASAGRAMLEMGLDYAVIKRGEYGAALFGDELQFAAPAFPLIDVVDPTGAGDSFAGGFMGYLSMVDDVDDDALRNAVVAGSTLASITVQDFGLSSLANLDPEAIQQRYGDFARLTRYGGQAAGSRLELR